MLGILFSFWLTCLMAAGTAAEPEPAADKGLAEAVRLLEAGMSAWEPQGFEEPARRLAALCASSTEPAPWYWSAVSQFHRILCLRSAGGDAAGMELWEDALRTLDRALELDPANAECYVMRGALHGMRIARQPASALWLGRKVLGDQRLALQHGRDNPRVRYLNGISIYRASKGRDGAKALRELREAERLFDAEAQRQSEPLAPRWGYDHCLFLIGEIYRDGGDSAKAIEYFRKAAGRNPRLEKARQALRQLSPS